MFLIEDYLKTLMSSVTQQLGFLVFLNKQLTKQKQKQHNIKPYGVEGREVSKTSIFNLHWILELLGNKC